MAGQSGFRVVDARHRLTDCGAIAGARFQQLESLGILKPRPALHKVPRRLAAPSLPSTRYARMLVLRFVADDLDNPKRDIALLDWSSGANGLERDNPIYRQPLEAEGLWHGGAWSSHLALVG